MLSRRAFLAADLLRAGELRAEDDALLTQLRQIEQSVSGHFGVAVNDGRSGRRWRYRGDERFPLCSTFRLLACAALLLVKIYSIRSPASFEVRHQVIGTAAQTLVWRLYLPGD